MKNFTMKLAATLLIFSGCAQNDLIDSPDQGTSNDGKVRFSATSALTGTRAADGNPFNNTQALQTLGSFMIDGYYNSTSIYGVAAQKVEWNGGSWEYANEPYWPTGDEVKIDFFAYANWDTNTKLTFASTGITAAHKDGGDNKITIAEDKLDGNGQKDLLVGGHMGATKQSRTLITFKHALTQVVFKAGNVNSTKLDVKIGGVRIVNVDNAASQMTFNGTKITWTLSGTATAKYHVQGLETATDWSNAINIDKDNAYTAPTDATLGDYSNYTVIQKTAGAKNNALLLLPQTFAAWNPNNAAGDGSYIELLAVVKDPTNASDQTLKDANNEEKVKALKPYYYCGTPNYVDGTNNTESYGIIRIPVSSVTDDLGEWIAGKRITYLITFGDSGSGSGGGGYNPGGDPILVPIRFNAIVENWVDVNVPLLTATFNANSGSVDGTFIDGYTNQLINDIKSARTPKVYKSSIKVTGQLSQVSDNQKITVSGLNDNNILVGSTVTYDFSRIDLWNKTLTIEALPTNWSAKYYKDATTSEVSSNPKLDGSSTNIVVLTKTSELDANITYSSVAPEYISDFISAIRINEGTTARADEWVINVKGSIAKDITFSADELALLGGTAGTSKVTIKLSNATFESSKKLSVIVPAGWKATWGSATKYVGETLEATANTSNITFIKL